MKITKSGPFILQLFIEDKDLVKPELGFHMSNLKSELMEVFYKADTVFYNFLLVKNRYGESIKTGTYLGPLKKGYFYSSIGACKSTKFNFNTPYISVNDQEVYILGDKKNLKNLGETLLLKSKLEENLQIILKDGVNLPIRIECDKDIL